MAGAGTGLCWAGRGHCRALCGREGMEWTLCSLLPRARSPLLARQLLALPRGNRDAHPEGSPVPGLALCPLPPACHRCATRSPRVLPPCWPGHGARDTQLSTCQPRIPRCHPPTALPTSQSSPVSPLCSPHCPPWQCCADITPCSVPKAPRPQTDGTRAPKPNKPMAWDCRTHTELDACRCQNDTEGPGGGNISVFNKYIGTPVPINYMTSPAEPGRAQRDGGRRDFTLCTRRARCPLRPLAVGLTERGGAGCPDPPGPAAAC